MKENQIKAVHQQDLKKLLKSLHVYDSVTSNTATCYFCNETMSLDTIAAVFPFNDAVCFCCDQSMCCSAMIDLEQEDETLG
ncbi:MAG TPA: hypothetical protein DEB10_13340 [Ruminococcaceae bacterium]|nr:hypothetical protein [Oscillospiraceae bacterium]HCA30345.1 hypothetical protein [Oscillospiraceae bacterium]